MELSGAALNISAVERETGLSKDVLRVWERRYGFPHPDRDDNAERQYAADEVAKLRAIKRLMDTGLRPGKLIRQSFDELNVLAEQRVHPRRDAIAPAIERDVLTLLKAHDVALSFSMAFPLRQIGDALASLRRALPSAVALWAGGEVTRRLRKSLPGVQVLPEITDALTALKTWRAESGQSGTR